MANQKPDIFNVFVLAQSKPVSPMKTFIARSPCVPLFANPSLYFPLGS